ncbi:hypothetical protein BC939DRAFT_438436, partial [Gamsiella multidivaricata]|uniref:uncharacterized protein n=1 Tax=Gamsiella multidivaricata TaxID=101098 RepID=UPI00222009FE
MLLCISAAFIVRRTISRVSFQWVWFQSSTLDLNARRGRGPSSTLFRPRCFNSQNRGSIRLFQVPAHFFFPLNNL